jgi:predicted DNA repair protein MutK
LHHLIENAIAPFSGLVAGLLSNGANLVIGFIIGSIVLLVVNLIAKLRE